MMIIIIVICKSNTCNTQERQVDTQIEKQTTLRD